MTWMKKCGYALMFVGTLVILSGCHVAVKQAEKADKTIYEALPEWM